MLTPFVALFASTGRGYLPALGWAFATLFLAQVAGMMGWADWFPWSVPGLFSPVWIDGHLLIDGGVSNPTPVDVARELASDVVVAVDVLVDPAEVEFGGIPYLDARQRILEFTRRPGSAPRNGHRFHPSVFSVLFQMSTVFQKRLSDLRLMTHPPDVLIRPDFSADPPCYSDVGCGFEAGEEAARAALPKILRALERSV